MTSTRVFNPVIKTYIFKDDRRTKWWMEHFEKEFKVSDEDDECDVVFICGSQQIQLGMTASYLLFPVLKDIILSAFHNTAGFGRTKDTKIWISLDDIKSETLVSLLHGVTANTNVSYTSSMIKNLQELMIMMKCNQTLLQFEKTESHGQDQVRPAPVTLNEAMEVDQNQGSPTSSQGRGTAPSSKLSSSKKLSLQPKKSGTKRKNLNDAIENITSKKKAKEEQKPLPKSNLDDEFKCITEDFIETDSNATEQEEILKGISELPSKYFKSGEVLPEVPIPQDWSEAVTSYELETEVKPEAFGTYDDIKEEKELIQASQEIYCPEDGCQKSDFKSRSEFLQHFALQHVLDQFLESYPFILYFILHVIILPTKSGRKYDTIHLLLFPSSQNTAKFIGKNMKPIK